MRSKYKLTGFARFTIFLLMISPFCYLGAWQYQNNSDVRDYVEYAKEEFKRGWESVDETENVEKTIDIGETEVKETEIETNTEIKAEIEDLKQRIKDLEALLDEKGV